MLVQYKNRASRCGLQWNLADDEAFSLFGGDCFYCGSAPAPRDARKGGAQRQVNRERKNPNILPFVCNGIDRVDSSEGYVRGNVVSCCTACNRAKRDSSADAFESWILRAAEHLLKRKGLALVS